METKKNPSADLELKKPFFLQAGLIVSLTLALAAFEWQSPVQQVISLPEPDDFIIADEIAVPVTRDIPKPPPPVTTVINLVDSDIETGDDPFIDAETSQDERLPFYEHRQSETPALAEEAPVEDNVPISVPQVMPEFPGGYEALLSFLKANITYPAEARASNIEGTVYLGFVVERDGTVSDIRILRKIGGGCEEEALRVASLMPKWTPGYQFNRPVRVAFTMPVKFTLAR
jgi:protein TonB